LRERGGGGREREGKEREREREREGTRENLKLIKLILIVS